MRRLFDAITYDERVARHGAVGHSVLSWVFHAGLLLLVILALTTTACLAVWNGNRSELLRRVAVLVMQDALDRRVELGAIRLNFRTLQLLDLRVFEAPDKPRASLTTRELAISYDLARLLRTHKPVGSLRRIVVDTPVMRLEHSQDSDLRKLFETDRKPGDDPFRAEVILRRGQLYIDDQIGLVTNGTPFREHFTNLNGRMLPVNNDLIPFMISGRMATRRVATFAVHGSLRLLSDGTECQLNLGAVDLAFVNSFLPKSLPLTLTSGRADARVQLRFTSRFEEFTSTLAADIHDVVGTVHYTDKDTPFYVANGQVKMATDVIEFANIVAVIGDVPLAVEGNICSAGEVTVNLRVRFADIAPARVLELIPNMEKPPIEFSGLATGWARVTGRSSALQVLGHVDGLSASAEFSGAYADITDISTDVLFQQGVLQLRDMSAQAFGGNFRGRGTLLLKDVTTTEHDENKLKLLLSGEVNDMRTLSVVRTFADDALLSQMAIKDLTGTLSGPITLGMTHDGDLSLMMQPYGVVGVRDRLDARMYASLTAQFPAEGAPSVSLARLELWSEAGALRVKGKLAEGMMSLDVQGSQLNITRLATLVDGLQDISGRGYFSGIVDIDMRTAGETAIGLRQGVLRVQDGQIQHQPFSDLSGRISSSILLKRVRPQLTIAAIRDPAQLPNALGLIPIIDPSSFIRLEDLRLLSGNRQIEVAAREITLNPNLESSSIGQWQVSNLTLSRSRISALAAMFNLALPIDGFVEGTITSARYAGTHGEQLSPEATGVAEITIYRPTLTIPLTPEQSAKFLPAGQQAASVTLGLDKVSLAFEVLPYLSRTKNGQAFPYKLQITRANFEYEGLPGEVAMATIPEGYITPDDFRLVVSGKNLPVKNFVAFTGDERLTLQLHTEDGRILLPVDLDGSVSIELTLAGPIEDDFALGATGIDISARVEGGADFTIAGVSFQRLRFGLHFDFYEQQLVLDTFELSPDRSERDYLISLQETTLYRAGATFSPNGTIRLSGVEADTPANLAHLRQDLLDMAQNTVAQIERSQDLLTISATPVDFLNPATTASPLTPRTLLASLQEAVRQLQANRLSGAFAGTVIMTPLRDRFGEERGWSAAVAAEITLPILNGLDMPNISTEFRLNNLEMPTAGDTQREIVIDHFTARNGFQSQMQVDIIRDFLIVDGSMQQLEPRIVLPRRGAFGETIPGIMSFHIKAQDINPTLFFGLIPRDAREQRALQERFAGEIQLELYTLEGATTADPKLQATIEWIEDPVAMGIPFQRLSMLLTLENAPGANEKHLQRLWIGQRVLGEQGASNIQLVRSNQPGPQQIEFNGFIPLNAMHWLEALLQPAQQNNSPRTSLLDIIAWDEEFSLNIRVPRQSLASIKEYLLRVDPRLQVEEEGGSIEGHIALGGTVANPRFQDITHEGSRKTGFLRVDSRELYLNFPLYAITVENILTNEAQVKYAWSEQERIAIERDTDNWRHISSVLFWHSALPDRITDATMELAFYSREAAGETINAVDLRDLSAFFDRRGASAKPRYSLIERIRMAFGAKPKIDVLPSFVSQGSVQLSTPRNGWGDFFTTTISDRPLLARLQQQLRYDFYAKTLRTPLKSGGLFTGELTAYLHLGNTRPGNPTPLLNGIIFAENSRLIYRGGEAKPFVMPALPFNPDLSLFVQIGEKCSFEFEPSTSFLQRNTFYADLRFAPSGTQLFSPESVADAYAMQPVFDPLRNATVRKDSKPFLDSHSPIFALTADSFSMDTLHPIDNGSYGTVTGRASEPLINVYYVLAPRKSVVQLPGGILSVTSAYGRLRDYRIGSVELPQLSVYAEAQGSVDNYIVKAIVNSDDFFDPEMMNMPTGGNDTGEMAQGALTFMTVSAPAGMAPLGHSEIYARLIGFNNLVALVLGKEDIFSARMVSNLGQNFLWDRWLRSFAGVVNLESISLRLDPNWSPVATITTPEFLTTRYSAFRLGIENTFADTPTWRMWLDYRIPTSSVLRNLTLRAELNSDNSYSIGLQYMLQFELSKKGEYGITYSAPLPEPSTPAPGQIIYDMPRYLGPFPDYTPPHLINAEEDIP